MPVLGDFCYISKGMVLNSDEKTAKGEFSKDDLISEVCDAMHPRPYIEAKDIEPYRVKNVRYLEYDTPRCPDKLSRPTFRELYLRKKLIMNCLGTINVAIDEGCNYLHNHSLSCAILWNDLKGVEKKSITTSVKRYSRMKRVEMERLSEQVDLRYLLGILNSKYTSVLLANLRGGDYHIYPEHLRNLPVPLADKAHQQPIISLVEQILAAKQGRDVACRVSTDAAATTPPDTSALEAEIDVLVYKLYDLDYDEVKIIDPEFLMSEEEYKEIKINNN
jgi:adenine-specific DNA-methyltransferase